MKRLLALGALCCGLAAKAQNPIISGQFTADPTARVFNGRMYLYPSHDIPAPIGYERKDWFCMADYHVFSSANLVDWTDHGIIITQNQVPWVEPDSYSMWAPDCVEKNGTYYFYFPSAPRGKRGFGVGVATAKSPEGPFTPMQAPIDGIMGIDPCVLIDDDGQSYIYWSGMGLKVARLKDNMVELDCEPQPCEGLPEGFKEGPFAFKRQGKYYLTFPWVRGKKGEPGPDGKPLDNHTETLAYAMSDSPFGPFEFKGLIMEEWPNLCWTNHHSIVEYNGQWYLFYHHNDYSPQFDKNRSTCVDYLNFNPDGTIQPVKPTLRGVGVSDARGRIDIDRYSAIDNGASIDYLNPGNCFDGWKTIFPKKGAWVRYNTVDFGSVATNIVSMRTKSKDGATLRIEATGKNGKATVLAVVKVPKSEHWSMTQSTSLQNAITGINDITVTLTAGNAEVDYISFGAPQPAEGYATEHAGVANGNYFTLPANDTSRPDADGFIRRWWLLDPIDKPNRTNTVFTDSYLREAFSQPYFADQHSVVPQRDGQTAKAGKQKLQWHNLESTGFNVHLFRFASKSGKQVYGVLFWAVTVIDCEEDINDVRLSVGSNSASMWWLDGEEALLLSGDRRMVADDAMSRRMTLKKGRHVLRGAIINGPGMSNFCVRFLDAEGKPVTNLNISK